MKIGNEKDEILYMMNLLLREKMITEYEFNKAKDKVNQIYGECAYDPYYGVKKQFLIGVK